jgi:hypothetical protein
MQRNPDPPEDFDDAVEGYERFTKFKPKEVGLLDGLVLPSRMYLVGEGIHVLYRSDKWEKKKHDYIHDHDPGVNVCLLPDPMHDFGYKPISVPDFIKNTKTIYLLGECIGFKFKRLDGRNAEAKITRPLPELYATPNGKALLVVETHGRRAKLAAAFWGGRLDVRAEGIVG